MSFSLIPRPLPLLISRPRQCRLCLSQLSQTRFLSTRSRPLAGPRSIITQRHLSSSTTPPTTPPRTPLKLAIIGAGPSGFYTASRVLASLPLDSPGGREVEVHMYERLPTPYGLVRYGVAPDHPEVKNCQHKFDDLAKDSRFRYFGNVLVTSQPSIPSSASIDSASSDAQTQTQQQTQTQPTALSPYTYPCALRLPLSSLTPHYNALLLSYGASLSNPLSSVPGSSSSPSPLANVHPALALVGWYNGHPAYTDLNIDLRDVEEVVVVGQGNVALDVARILLKNVDELRKTDVPESVLGVLADSRVRKVSVVGRRGAGQVAFTTKEFREMLGLEGVVWRGLGEETVEEAKGMVVGDRMRNRLLGLMEKPGKYQVQQDQGEGEGKEFVLEFLKSPKAFLPATPSTAQSITPSDTQPTSPRVGHVEWTINSLLVPPPTDSSTAQPSSPAASRAGVVARPTGETVRMRADMVVESVGYRSEPLGPVGVGVGVGVQPGEGAGGGEAKESGDGNGHGDGYWTLPFDEKRGRVENVGGRVVGDDGIAIPGVYAAGWVSRGPIGVIASTMQDAYTVADQILGDHYEYEYKRDAVSAAASVKGDKGRLTPLAISPAPGAPRSVEDGLKEGIVVDLERWGRIDGAERERGVELGKEREKFTRVEDMMRV